nr:MAG TPA: DNA polymerase III, alpha subunit [Herelleviridae sp.]
MKLLKKKYKQYVGKVYDLEVDSEDHSYVINHKVVHNSAGGCLISYLLAITKLDPIGYNLLFERFLNEGRVGYWKDEQVVTIDFEDGRQMEFDSKKKLVVERNGQHIELCAKDFEVGDNILAY